MKIDDIIATAQDGTPVTVADRIVEFLRAGNYVETAALATGVTKECVYNWLRVAATAGRKQAQGQRLTRNEQRCLAFSDAVARGQAEAEIRDVTRLAALAQGGTKVEVVTEKYDADDALLERTIRTQTLEPDARTLMWRLERRFSRRWGQRGSLEVTGVDGGPLVLDADTLIAKLRAAREANDGDVDANGNDDDGVSREQEPGGSTEG